MSTTLKSMVWDEWIGPMFRRPHALQIAALCLRDGEDGAPEVLLVTSRGTGRWIIPKGWPSRKKDGPGTAMEEAWEEAGLRDASVDSEPLGEYVGTKGHGGGLNEPTRVLVYALHGGDLAEEWPEAGQRRRRWVSVQEAMRLIAEPGLRDLLARL